MNGNELLEKIDLLIDQDANRDITRFCGAVKGLVEEVYGTEHPFVQKHTVEGQVKGVKSAVDQGHAEGGMLNKWVLCV